MSLVGTPRGGTSNEGEFKGKYYTKTGEVDCDVELGGMTLAGLDQPVHHGGNRPRSHPHGANIRP